MIKIFKNKYNLTNEKLNNLEQEISDYITEETDNEMLSVIKCAKNTCTKQKLLDKKYPNLSIILFISHAFNIDINTFIKTL